MGHEKGTRKGASFQASRVTYGNPTASNLQREYRHPDLRLIPPLTCARRVLPNTIASTTSLHGPPLCAALFSFTDIVPCANVLQQPRARGWDHGGPLVGEEFIRTPVIRYAINQVSEKQLLFHVRKDVLSFPIQLAVLDQVNMTALATPQFRMPTLSRASQRTRCICQSGLRGLSAMTGLPAAKTNPTSTVDMGYFVEVPTGNEVFGTAHVFRHSLNPVVAYPNARFRPGRLPAFSQSSRRMNRLSPHIGAQLCTHSITGLGRVAALPRRARAAPMITDAPVCSTGYQRGDMLLKQVGQG
ncbi:hypothetical protein EDB89DRAFT_2242069 [Lactarius sanguifluus]|nr:hypothetical protein EDB89DRAFT_2242069 [Lactarius sanguifluus]